MGRYSRALGIEQVSQRRRRAAVLIAVSLLAIVVAGLTYLRPGFGKSPAPSAAARPTHTAPSPSPILSRSRLVTSISLPAGAYSLANPYLDENGSCLHPCSGYQQILFTLPAGWANRDGLLSKHLNQPGEVAFSAWTVGQVYLDPCHWLASALGPLDIVKHVDPVSGAFIFLDNRDGSLSNQRGRNASALTQVTLGGVRALKIDLSVPANLDISTCDRREFRSWTSWDVVDGANSHNAPGQLDTVYMVDVDRMTLVIDASHSPAASDADLAELEAVLASMIIA